MPSKLAMLFGSACGSCAAENDETLPVLGAGNALDFGGYDDPRYMVDVLPQNIGFGASLATIESGYNRLVGVEGFTDLGLVPIETLPTLGEAREAVWQYGQR